MNSPTLKDIALKAGVSQQTVSKVLNNRLFPVKKKTREKIQKAARELDYHPNYLAQSLKSGKRNAIGVAGGGSLKEMNDLFVSTIYAGIGEVVEQRDCYMTFFSQGADYYRNIVRMAKNRMVDGLIVLLYSSRRAFFADNTLPVLHQAGIPFVVIQTTAGELPCPHVGFDAQAAGSLTACHLLDQGCRTITNVTSVTPGFDDDFTNGYSAAMRDRRAPVNSIRLSDKGRSARLGFQWGQEVLQQHRPLTDAYIINADSLALGFIRAFTEAGVHVPGDAAVMGCDNLFPNEENMLPTLSTIDRQPYQVGKKAGEFLFEIMDSQNSWPASWKRHIFQPELVVRETSIWPKR